MNTYSLMRTIENTRTIDNAETIENNWRKIGVPNRFFKSDFQNGPKNLNTKSPYLEGVFNARMTYLAYQLCTKAETNNIAKNQWTSTVPQIIQELNIPNVKRAYRDTPSRSKFLQPDYFGHRYAIMLESPEHETEYIMLHHLLAYYRVFKATGINPLELGIPYAIPRPQHQDWYTHTNALDEMAEALENIITSDIDMIANNNSQKRYLRKNDAECQTQATAYMDKKNQRKTLVELAKNSPLRSYFRHIELDADVDENEWTTFETQIMNIMPTLPKTEQGPQPELRVRKLGRHKASGIFFRKTNTIVVDVRDVTSFIHEYAHHVDLILKDSFSTSREFQNIVRTYQQNLNKKAVGSKVSYYCTPTEIFARATEMLFANRIGENHCLLSTDRLKTTPYEPFHNIMDEVENVLTTNVYTN